jgi:hypothetical protein
MILYYTPKSHIFKVQGYIPIPPMMNKKYKINLFSYVMCILARNPFFKAELVFIAILIMCSHLIKLLVEAYVYLISIRP